MNAHLKKELQNAFSAQPDRLQKERFLRSLPRTRISSWQFVGIQFSYLRKGALLLSALLLFPALIGVHRIERNTVWIISALIPFLGLAAVTECTRSGLYGMNELELSSRFSLKSVVLARLLILGLVDTLVFCLLLPLCRAGSRLSFLQTGMYLMIPYLLTVNISLWITRHFPGREGFYGCLAVAAGVSMAAMILPATAVSVYQASYLPGWILLFFLLLGKTADEIYKMLRQTEEYPWNLSLTD